MRRACHMQYMCDAGLHAVLEKDARKYARLPEFWQLASCASGTFNSIISHEGSCNIQNARRDMLRRALMTCALGDDSARRCIKSMFRDILIEKYRVNERNINEVIVFDSPSHLNHRDKFHILLYVFEKSYGCKALQQLIICAGTGKHRTVHAHDIDRLYENYMPVLNFYEKLEVLTQKIYSTYKGIGAADSIMTMDIDGLAGGWGQNRTIWVMCDGRPVNLEFLRFDNQREFRRIMSGFERHIYNTSCRRSSSGVERKEKTGYISGYLYNGAEVIVASSPVCSSKIFFIKK